MILRHTFSPPDNLRMGHLCGPMDSHIRSIEAGLQVKVAHRFEQFRIEGPKAKANQALETLQALYEMAKKPIPAETVQLMLSGDTALAEPGATACPNATEVATRAYIIITLLPATPHVEDVLFGETGVAKGHSAG
ncbi:NAD(P)-binding domain-containing protein, partial [Hydrogenophaga aromaticivorans]|uniref:NAD(P)-binding domain-containing protein n=1 Tax=Hydrogenophaga aromaticivorans TaxID=2610898 RepID=UPI0031E89A47